MLEMTKELALAILAGAKAIRDCKDLNNSYVLILNGNNEEIQYKDATKLLFEVGSEYLDNLEEGK